MAKEMFFNGTFNTFFFFLLLLLRHPSSCNAVNLKPCGFNKIYNFGDSITDTGNAKVEFPGDEGWGFPLGVTIGNDVTGRFCDGLLIIDRIARREHIKSSLFVIGGGSNDYVNLHGPPGLGVVVERKLMMPDMMKCLTDAIKKFISYGATRIVVIGLPQGGCWPGNSQPDNKLHCDPVANEYHAIHNLLVQNEIQQLNKDFPDVLVAYGDIWGSSQWVWDRYKSLGFSFPQKSCCGSWELPCGFKGAPYCGKPKEYVHWDSTGHFTDAAYRYMSKQMIPRIYSGLKCSATRPTAKIEL
ncbi:GDSL esterase/lipase At5g03980 [Linum perenne]